MACSLACSCLKVNGTFKQIPREQKVKILPARRREREEDQSEILMLASFQSLTREIKFINLKSSSASGKAKKFNFSAYGSKSASIGRRQKGYN
jgi:hypothetical protein